ncbi:hypothetical protein [Acinetobacter sp. UBA6720]|uniref:hypothetical protein n=1 Tax=Acinetobacter sp. UBA6720 TaxID=1945953 RepID=UPI0025C62508|nr:hypothetical protein [Acinetobacter sp. UBA6720]
MVGVVRDQNLKLLMMWLVCIVSLSLCLHFNTHVVEANYQEHTAYETELVHFHDVQQKKNHVHHDNFHEHFKEYQSNYEIGLLFIILNILIIDWQKAYLYLMISRIFKPPKSAINFKFLINFGV